MAAVAICTRSLSMATLLITMENKDRKGEGCECRTSSKRHLQFCGGCKAVCVCRGVTFTALRSLDKQKRSFDVQDDKR